MSDISSSSWIKKYTPNQISDIVGNYTQIQKIKSWLQYFEKYKEELKDIKVLEKEIPKPQTKTKVKTKVKVKVKPKPKKRTKTIKAPKNTYCSILITGNHGVGKTTLANIVMRELGYEIVLFNPTAVKTTKKSKSKAYNIFSHLSRKNSVIDIINNTKNKNKCILIDELESISSSTDKQNVLNLLKDNEISYNFPIIFISNNKHNKLLSDIKKISLEIKIWPLDYSNIKKILMNITLKEDIKINSESVVQKLIDYSQYDIRRLINILQDVKNTFQTKIVSVNNLDNYLESSTKKDVSYDLYKATDGLLTSYKSIDESLKYYETEKVLLPLMIHENHVKYIYYNVDSEDKQIDLSTSIAEVMSAGDVIENYIYGDQNWDLQELHGFYTCTIPSFYYNKNKDDFIERVETRFPQDLNKTSIKKINKKNIDNTNKCLFNMTIDDFIYINRIVKHLLEQNRIEECAELLKPYKMTKDHIESLLKIDKIDNTKASLTARQRKKFSILL